MKELEQKIAELEAKIEQLAQQLPKHSTPPAMIIQLEELEEELEEARKQLAAQKI
jgi:cell division septum initiation protein DivIVA